MPWYALYTKPRQELKAVAQLQALDIDVYCPTKTEVRQWSDRKKKVLVPLLPSYVFVFLDDTKRAAVFDAPAVKQYVFWLGKPAVIKNNEMALLKESIANPYKAIEIVGIQKGDTIEINSGPFKGKEAEVISISKNKKTKVILKELGVTLLLS